MPDESTPDDRLRDHGLSPVDPTEIDWVDIPESTERTPSPTSSASTNSVKQAPIRKGFGLGKAVLYVLLYVIVIQLGAVVIGSAVGVTMSAVLDRNADINENNIPTGASMKPAALVGIMACVEIFGLLTGWLLLRYVVGRRWKDRVALHRPQFVHVLLALATLPPLFALEGVLEQNVYVHFPDTREYTSDIATTLEGTKSWPIWLSILLIGIGPGIQEELFCRGFLGQGLARRYGTIFSIVAVSIIFGIIHIEPKQAFNAMLLGFWLHALYLWSRSLWIPILLHATHNGIIVASIPDNNTAYFDSLNLATQTQPLALALTAAFSLLCWMMVFHSGRRRVYDRFGEVMSSEKAPHVQAPPLEYGGEIRRQPLSLVWLLAALAGTSTFVSVWLDLGRWFG